MQAIGRIGNFFNQELYGPPTNLPWGIAIDCAHRVVEYPCDALPRGDDRLPAAVPVRVAERRRSAPSRCSGSPAVREPDCGPGDLLLIFFIWYGAVRFALESLRATTGRSSGCRRRCWSRSIVIVLSLIVLAWRHRPGSTVERWGDPPPREDELLDDEEWIEDDMLPPTPAKTGTPSIVVHFESHPIEKDWNVYRLLDTESWYPQTGEVNRAAHDVTFHWPQGLDLMAGGRRVDGGEAGGDGAGSAASSTCRSSATPSSWATSTSAPPRPATWTSASRSARARRLTGRGTRESVMKAVKDSLRLLRGDLRPLSLRRADRGHGQPRLLPEPAGFMTLSDFLLNDAGHVEQDARPGRPAAGRSPTRWRTSGGATTWAGRATATSG